jgi:hypothetical protein
MIRIATQALPEARRLRRIKPGSTGWSSRCRSGWWCTERSLQPLARFVRGD